MNVCEWVETETGRYKTSCGGTMMLNHKNFNRCPLCAKLPKMASPKPKNHDHRKVRGNDSLYNEFN